ncbi:hypothetical protein PIB30_109160, partial [Stylosanthes scabra]|nr:hypothetical protein [Stylosanthes scabra]
MAPKIQRLVSMERRKLGKPETKRILMKNKKGIKERKRELKKKWKKFKEEQKEEKLKKDKTRAKAPRICVEEHAYACYINSSPRRSNSITLRR